MQISNLQTICWAVYCKQSTQPLPLSSASHSCRAAVVKAIESGESVNAVEAAGNTPLHCAAYEGWLEGMKLLLSLGAKVSGSHILIVLSPATTALGL